MLEGCCLLPPPYRPRLRGACPGPTWVGMAVQPCCWEQRSPVVGHGHGRAGEGSRTDPCLPPAPPTHAYSTTLHTSWPWQPKSVVSAWGSLRGAGVFAPQPRADHQSPINTGETQATLLAALSFFLGLCRLPAELTARERIFLCQQRETRPVSWLHIHFPRRTGLGLPIQRMHGPWRNALSLQAWLQVRPQAPRNTSRGPAASCRPSKRDFGFSCPGLTLPDAPCRCAHPD